MKERERYKWSYTSIGPFIVWRANEGQQRWGDQFYIEKVFNLMPFSMDLSEEGKLAKKRQLINSNRGWKEG